MEHVNQVDHGETDITRLERQVERSQLFTHTALGESFARVGETSAFVHGLIDVLLDKGVVTEDEVRSAVANVHQQLAAQGEFAGAGTLIRLEDTPEVEERTIEVDCQARLPVCQAVCCKLNFALTIREIESGAVKWDLGRPYHIRHEEDGYCTHLQHNGGGCRIYAIDPVCAATTAVPKTIASGKISTKWNSTPNG